MAEILIVEDERIVAEDIKERLKNLGYTSSVAPSGERALQEAGKASPDLVLMDIVLGGTIDGIEAAQILHSLEPGHQIGAAVVRGGFGGRARMRRILG